MIQWMKDHKKYLIGAGVILLILLAAFFFGGNNGKNGSSADGTEERVSESTGSPVRLRQDRKRKPQHRTGRIRQQRLRDGRPERDQRILHMETILQHRQPGQVKHRQPEQHGQRLRQRPRHLQQLRHRLLLIVVQFRFPVQRS